MHHIQTAAPCAHRPARGVWGRLTMLLSLARSRRHLARLDAGGRADVGIDETAANRESIRPIWDIPPHWRNLR